MSGSDSTDTVEVIILELGTGTASDMIMQHVLIILTSAFVQCHTDLDHENDKCSIMSETVQAMPITFAVKIVRLKVHKNYTLFQPDDLALNHSRRERVKQ